MSWRIQTEQVPSLGGSGHRRVRPSIERTIQFHIPGYDTAGSLARVFCAVAESHYSAGIQVLSGLYSDIVDATFAVSGPRSFSNALPSWLMMKVITPEVRYTAG